MTARRDLVDVWERVNWQATVLGTWPDTQAELGAAVRQERTRRGVSLSALAEAMQCTAPHLSRVERAEEGASVTLALRLANWLIEQDQ